jgi:GH15 family glucan-1,4-alpha-glucosidase
MDCGRGRHFQHVLLLAGRGAARAGQAFPEKLDQARLPFERVLGYANHLGLYAEQTGPQGEALGNFPQAFTHLALISAAFNLDRMLSS